MAKNTQKGLGKGLGALFSETPAPGAAAQEAQKLLPIQKLEPNPNQPRREFDPEALAELADSIRTHGLIQPIAVRPLDSGFYQIIAGERRWRACREAGLSQVPVVILEADEQKAAQLALIENLQREDLNPIEEAQGFAALMERHGLTQEQVADSVSKSRTAVTNTLRLLKLPESIRKMVVDGSISAGHGRALLSLDREIDQIRVAQRIVKEQLSVRQTERLVKQFHNPENIITIRDPLAVDYVQECQIELARRLNRKVIIRNTKGKGRIELEFYDEDDMQLLLDGLMDMELAYEDDDEL